MFLIDIKKAQPLKYITTEDSVVLSRLYRFGFISGITIKVLRVHKKNYLVECMGSVYFLNSNMASKIRVELLK